VSRGAATVAVGFASLAVGSGIGSSALIVCGVALAVVVVYAAAVALAASRWVTVDRRAGAAEVVEGEPLELEIRLAVRYRLGVVCELASPGGPPVQLRPGANRVTIAFERRGRHLLEPARVLVRDPLGLFARKQRGGESVAVLVLPRGQKGPQAPRRRELLRESDPVDLDGLREYRPGTPASRVHWPSLARGAGLIERQLTDARVQAPLYVVDTNGAVDDADADRIVRAAVAQILQWARAGGCEVLLPGDEAPASIGPDLRGWREIHRRLAVLERAS
jgi:uncharacterized protein (DUF58 family)